MKQILALLVIIHATILPAVAQNVTYIKLKQEKAGYAPRNYHITAITDDRTDTGSIGRIIGSGDKSRVFFHNGAASSLTDYIANNVTQDKNTQPVTLHVSNLDMEARKQGPMWRVDVATTYTFYVGGKKVVEYSGKSHGEMNTDPAEYMETNIRQTLDNDLKKFDQWWSENKGRIATTSAVKVNVSIGRAIDKPNCIVYSAREPLQIADFTGRPEEGGKELAITTSGIAMAYSSQTENSQVVVDVTIIPYFNKTLSWFKPAGKNPHVLAHEQAHFDITAIKAYELATAIRNASFTQENYISRLGDMQTKNSQDSYAEETKYDSETNHGTIPDQQEAWEKRLKEQIKTLNNY
jgi:hypothetical protein